jgi:branched-subunit amino acid ABC-type transport system permease component
LFFSRDLTTIDQRLDARQFIRLLAISFAIIYGVLKLVNFATGALYMMGAICWLDGRNLYQ